MGSRPRSGLLVAFVCSFGVHFLLVWIVPQNASLPLKPLSQKSIALVVFETFPQTVRDLTISESPVVPPETIHKISQSETPNSQSKRIADPVDRSTRADPEIEADEKKEPTVFSAPSEATEASVGDGVSRPNSKDLSPRSAALSMMDGASPGCSPSGSVSQTDAHAENHEERLQKFLSGVASDRPYLKRRDPPQLHRQTDGSYRFEGHVFNARIEKDGRVAFRDRQAASLLPLFSSDTSDKADKNLFYSGFDLTDAVEKHLLDKEIYTYEKQRFLRETAELRERLEREHRAELYQKAERRLRGRLILIKEDSGKPNPDKRKDIFALWDDCSGDRIGRYAQELIERFIRDEMPKDSALGFSQEEINAFNRRRISRRVFDPYKAQPLETTVQTRG